MKPLTENDALLLAASEVLGHDAHVSLGRSIRDGSPIHVDARLRARADHWQRELDRLLSQIPSMRLLWVGGPEYPTLLRLIADPPPVLFVNGTYLSDRDGLCLAVVGSRRASTEGLGIAYALGAEAAHCGVTVISGLAAGIDSEAHQGALDAGGRTIGVLGSGIDVVVPPANVELAPRIRDHGCLMSQFLPGDPPTGTNFLSRNRVIAGLSVVSVVVEAEEISGSRDEAEHALNHGRLVIGWAPSFSSGSWLERLVPNGRLMMLGSVGEILDRFFDEYSRIRSVG